jgi:hypothetical protein
MTTIYIPKFLSENKKSSQKPSTNSLSSSTISLTTPQQKAATTTTTTPTPTHAINKLVNYNNHLPSTLGSIPDISTTKTTTKAKLPIKTLTTNNPKNNVFKPIEVKVKSNNINSDTKVIKQLLPQKVQQLKENSTKTTESGDESGSDFSTIQYSSKTDDKPKVINLLCKSEECCDPSLRLERHLNQLIDTVVHSTTKSRFPKMELTQIITKKINVN